MRIVNAEWSLLPLNQTNLIDKGLSRTKTFKKHRIENFSEIFRPKIFVEFYSFDTLEMKWTSQKYLVTFCGPVWKWSFYRNGKFFIKIFGYITAFDLLKSFLQTRKQNTHQIIEKATFCNSSSKKLIPQSVNVRFKVEHLRVVIWPQ